MLVLMQHEGSCHLDDVRHLKDDEALCRVLGLDRLPEATTLGDWLRRMGTQPRITDAWVTVNRSLLHSALHRCTAVTLDSDATEIVTDKADAQWTCNKHTGCMPMVGHRAETGQGVAVDVRQGTVSPAYDTLGCIQHCQQALPEGCAVKALRIDAAGYHTDIIK